MAVAPGNKPIVAITMGDPAGVGPEIIAKALLKHEIHDVVTPVVIGDRERLTHAFEVIGESGQAEKLNAIQGKPQTSRDSSDFDIYDLKNVTSAGFRPGMIKSEYGKAAIAYIDKSIELAMNNVVDAVVTSPIHKESFKAAGSPYPGHTEMFMQKSGAKHCALMLMVGRFRVVHVTLHVALKDVAKLINRDRVLDVIRIAHEGCLALGISQPRIGVAGLNPHAGDGGLFGSEEKNEILPAVEAARKQGLSVEGPLSADVIFAMLNGGKYDIVVCMYHDQGGIPMKLLSFDWDAKAQQWSRMRGVNVTLGLPIIRTSVAHGVGFDIAGRGIADSTSLEDAVRTAALLVKNRKKRAELIS